MINQFVLRILENERPASWLWQLDLTPETSLPDKEKTLILWSINVLAITVKLFLGGEGGFW